MPQKNELCARLSFRIFLKELLLIHALSEFAAACLGEHGTRSTQQRLGNRWFVLGLLGLLDADRAADVAITVRIRLCTRAAYHVPAHLLRKVTHVVHGFRLAPRLKRTPTWTAKDSRKDGDDCNNDHEFNERKSLVLQDNLLEKRLDYKPYAIQTRQYTLKNEKCQ